MNSIVRIRVVIGGDAVEEGEGAGGSGVVPEAHVTVSGGPGFGGGGDSEDDVAEGGGGGRSIVAEGEEGRDRVVGGEEEEVEEVEDGEGGGKKEEVFEEEREGEEGFVVPLAKKEVRHGHFYFVIMFLVGVGGKLGFGERGI